jgi:hypothetical protein
MEWRDGVADFFGIAKPCLRITAISAAGKKSGDQSSNRTQAACSDWWKNFTIP